MKNKLFLLCSIILFSSVFSSCKKEDEENELQINFKTATGYTFSDMGINSGESFKIGVDCSTEKKKDPIIKFNISESVNNGTATTVYSEDLESQNYSHDYEAVMQDSVSGNTHKFTFTITNRDGINKQKSITLTVQ
ncbi:MAG: hypothetical protein KDC13_03650 [Bacteroidetes bacterium]|nr:hypothetical protein [Bacteroidota bacterium]